MKTYTITNVQSGHTFGEYQGETPEAAIKAMMIDAGAPDEEPSDDLRAVEVKTLTGRAAIEYAREHDLALNKYADPIEGGREGLTVDEAEEIGREDLSLIYLSI